MTELKIQKFLDLFPKTGKEMVSKRGQRFREWRLFVLNTLKAIERANTRVRKAEGDVEVKIKRKRKSYGSLR